jgi:hypothetical protein
MTRWSDPDDDWDDDGRDPEDPDYPEDDEEPTLPCPYCRREIHEDAQRCTYCGHYISREDAPPARKPWWITLGVVACFFVVYRWIVWW